LAAFDDFPFSKERRSREDAENSRREIERGTTLRRLGDKFGGSEPSVPSSGERRADRDGVIGCEEGFLVDVCKACGFRWAWRRGRICEINEHLGC